MAIRTLGRLLFRAGGLFVLWAPFLALAARATAYVLECLDTLADPGAGLVYVMEGRGGPVTIRAKGYTFGVIAGGLVANEVVAVSHTGQTVASARRVTIRLPDLISGPRRTVVVYVDDLEGTIERDLEGRFSILDLLPPETKEPSVLPFRVDIERVRLSLIDRMGPELWVRRVQLPWVKVDGVGERWRATGLFLDAEGSALAAVRQEPRQRLTIEADFRNFDLARWLEPIRLSKEAKDWPLVQKSRFSRLLATGPAKLHVPYEGKALVSGSLAMAADDARYEDIRAPKVTLVARFHNTGFSGWVELWRPQANLKFVGTVGWEPEVLVQGQVDVQAVSREEIPQRFLAKLPKDLGFSDARYSGFVSYSERPGLSLHGQGWAESATWQEHALQNASAWLQVGPEAIHVRSLKGAYKETPVQGEGDFDLRARTIHAFASSDPFPIERFRQVLGITRLSGTAALQASAEGSLDKPQIEFRAKGSAKAEIEKGRLADIGPFHALARYREPSLEIERFAIAGPAGVATASGTVNLQTKKLDLDAVLSGVELSRLHSRLNGIGAGKLHATGTMEKFLAKGPVEIYGLEIEGQPVPLLSGEIEASQDRLLARELRGSRGAGRLRGEALWTFKTDALSGSFTAESVQLHDFLEEGAEGGLDVREGLLAGTLSKPIVEATIAGSDIVLRGVHVDSAEGRVRLEGRRVELLSSRLRAEEGTLEARASYDFEARAGSAIGEATALPISRIQPLLPPDTGIEGSVGGKFSAAFADGQIATFEGDGGIEGLSVNRAFLGNGFYALNASGKTWTGTLSVGQPERFLEVPGFTYEQGSDSLEAELVAYGMPVRDLYFASRPYMRPEPGRDEPRVELPKGLKDLLDRLQGYLDFEAHISGKATDPDMEIEALAVRNSSVDGEPAGELHAQATRLDRKWDISKLEWSGGPGLFTVAGSVVEGGALNLNGELNNLNTQWLQRFLPVFSDITGQATLSFRATGQAKSPEIEASLTGSFFETGDAKAATQTAAETAEERKDQALNVEIYPLLISEGQISVRGAFNFRGFTGNLDGKMPFHYPFEFPEKEPLEFTFHVPNRSLKELGDLIVGMDVRRSEGTVGADVQARGTLEDVNVRGGINLNAKSLAFRDVDTALQDVAGSSSLEGSTVRLSFGAKSSYGGSVQADARIALTDLASALQHSLEDLLASKVEGTVTFKDTRISERNLPIDPGPEHEAFVTSEMTANGEVALSGSLAAPLIKTAQPIVLSRVKGEVPTSFLAGKGTAEAYVNPRFDVGFQMGTRDEPAELKASASVLNLYGSGTLSGGFENLKAQADLRVRSGYVRLPNARISISEGGTVELLYENDPYEPELRLNVDMEGRTSLSTLKFGTVVEHYDIYLEIRGNLLNTDEQLITARADPPDLPQDRILALLGQIELFEKVSGQLLGTEDRASLQTMLAGLALPVVFDPVTEAIARQLGLEYLSLEYGPLGQTSIAAAKWLGKGFLVQARREISEPLDGLQDYDLRLSYRPPRRIKQLRNLTFSVGIDQERPWKLSVEYAGRLRNSGAPNKSNIIFIGPEPTKRPKPAGN